MCSLNTGGDIMESERFHVKVTDGLSRIGWLETKHGRVETPAFFPVHNIGTRSGWNTPRYWELFPKINTAMLNAATFMMNRGDSRVRRVLSVGVHKYLDFNGVVFIDSGGFLCEKYGFYPKQEDLLTLQQRLGADIASTLDYPISCRPLRDLNNVILTIKNAEQFLSCYNASDMLLYASIQGADALIIKNAIKYLKTQDDFDGFAIGSLMKKDNNYYLLVRLLLASRSSAGTLPLHVYGLSAPLIILLLIYLGIDTFDSSFFIVASANRYYRILGGGKIHLSKLREHEPLPCNCTICAKHSAEDLRRNRELLVLHNLWVLWQEIERAKKAIREGEFEAYLRDRFSHHKHMSKVLAYAAHKVRMVTIPW